MTSLSDMRQAVNRSVGNRIYRATLVTFRAKAIKANTEEYYHGVVHNFAMVSRVNNSLAFTIHRKGVFGSPVVKQIDRPKVVSLSDTDNYVIIRDGYVYDLRREER